jgi:hypothetical protein
MLDHMQSLAQATDAQMIGVIEPAHPTAPVFSGSGVCTREPATHRLEGCFTPADPEVERQCVLPRPATNGPSTVVMN